MCIKNSFYRWLLCISLFLLSYTFLQPTFEGFDETAHYSRILDASGDTKSQLSVGKPFRSVVLDYPGPDAYSSGKAPFSGDKTYDVFYKNSDDWLESVKLYGVASNYDNFSEKENWQYQHPPLYYLLAGSFKKLASTDTVVRDVLYLRIFSVILTIIGLFFCCKTLEILCAKNILNKGSLDATLGIFTLCFPMFYFEFARIGNDSLVFLCLSATFYFSVRAYQSSNTRLSLMYMSLTLGVGLWVKAVVLPLLPVFAIYAFICLWNQKSNKSYLVVLRDFLWVYLIPITLGLAWYVFLYLKFQEFGLGTEARDLGQSSGLIHGLLMNFSMVGFIRGLMVPFASFIYAGSWSLVRAPIIIYVILAVVYALILFRYCRYLLRSGTQVITLIPIGLFGALYAGLAYHVLISMALSGLGTSGGWYLYILTPWLLMVIGVAINKISSRPVLVIQSLGLSIFIFLFFANTLIYSGFIIKSLSKSMNLIGEISIDTFQEVIRRLDFVSYPTIAFILFFLGCLLVGFNFYFYKKSIQNNEYS